MKILLVGSGGQVGSALAHALPSVGVLRALDRTALDILDPNAIRSALRDVRPDVIVNAAAYTAVDQAERESQLAMAVNAKAPGALAREARATGALLVHFSTDYVFDGQKPTPYVETDAATPLNVYGQSKLEGEREIVASGCRHFVFRTSWVYAAAGRNFLRSILAAARTQQELRVVDDQRGSPTASGAIAAAVAAILSDPELATKPSGLYHLCAAGDTTWYGFARAILAAKGIATPLVAIQSSDYPAAARRPRNSCLDCGLARSTFGVALRDWRQELTAVLADV